MFYVKKKYYCCGEQLGNHFGQVVQKNVKMHLEEIMAIRYSFSFSSLEEGPLFLYIASLIRSSIIFVSTMNQQGSPMALKR